MEYELGVLVADAKRQQQSGGVADYENAPISAYRTLQDCGTGLKFSMFDLLNNTMRPARPGDNIAVAAPPRR